MMRRLFIILYALSGFCVLAQETIWIRRLGLEIGNTVISATMVVAAFFLCAALGNIFGSKLLKNTHKPLRIYGISETAAGLSAIILFPLAGSIYYFLHSLTVTPHITWLIHFIYAVLLVGIPAFCAGISFPALSDAFIDKADHRTTSGGKFYAANLIGAAAGIICGGIILPEWLGYKLAFSAVSFLYTIIGAIAIHYSSCTITSPPDIKRHLKKKKNHIVNIPSIKNHPNTGIEILISSGVLSIMLEMLVIIYFQQMMTGSLYVISSILFAFILNLGFGSLLASALRRREVPVENLLYKLLTICGFITLAYPFLFNIMLRQGVMHNAAPNVISTAIIATIALAPMLIPIGTIFPLAWEMIEKSAIRQGQVLGHAVAWNKAGSAIGAVIGPFLLVPVCGLNGAIILAGSLYLTLAILLNLQKRLIIVSVVLITFSIIYVNQPFKLQDGEKLTAIYQGADGIIGVVDDMSGSRHIVLNGTYTLNGTGRAFKSQQHESWIPLFFTPNPRRVAFIGMASGISADAALDFPISQLDAIELVPDVVKAAKVHFSRWNNRLFTDKRANIIVNDGRYIISAATQPYDTIIIDLLHPALEGTATLYSLDFLKKASKKLTPDGLCCLWLPLYQLDDKTAGIIINTFIQSFPNAIAVRGNFDPEQPVIGLVGSRQRINISENYIIRQIQSIAANNAVKSSPLLRSPANTRLLLLADLKSISSDFSTYPITTDNYPAFTFLASKNIPDSNVIRGIKLLHWFGNRVKTTAFPSCNLAETPGDMILRGINAGNNYYAAAVFQVPVQGDLYLPDRQKIADKYIIRARTLAPQTDITYDDLGK